jgi:hypothetical protein
MEAILPTVHTASITVRTVAFLRSLLQFPTVPTASSYGSYGRFLRSYAIM